MSDLNGRVALVTGGSRGIGAAIARRLAADGALVAVTYSASPDKAKALVESIGGGAAAIQADSGDTEAVKRAVAEVAGRFGRIDILVNNAGITRIAAIGDFTQADFDRMLDVNIRGVYTATQESLRHMGPGGRVIMLGSINGDWMPFPGGSIYALTKAAIGGFTRGLARDVGPRGITVNNIQPGPVDTDMNPADGPFASHLLPTLAVGRYGKAEEVAALVSFLSSAEAAYITGAQIRIDGGATA